MLIHYNTGPSFSGPTPSSINPSLMSLSPYEELHGKTIVPGPSFSGPAPSSMNPSLMSLSPYEELHGKTIVPGPSFSGPAPSSINPSLRSFLPYDELHGKTIVPGPSSSGPAPSMNPPPRSSSLPFEGLHGRCDGDGCASDPDTWPLHRALRRDGGGHCRVCSSCVLLSYRSMYCCRCFHLITTSWRDYDFDDELMAPPTPTVTCLVCREAVAHLVCLSYYYPSVNGGVFVCPPCAAAVNGRPAFTYAPTCRPPRHERVTKILVLASRMALARLNQHAASARAAADQMALEARNARASAYNAVKVALDLGAEVEYPSWTTSNSKNDDVAASEEEEEEESEGDANVDDDVEILLVRRKRPMMPPPPLAIDMGPGPGPSSSSVVPMTPPTEAGPTKFRLLSALTIGGAGPSSSVVPVPMPMPMPMPATVTTRARRSSRVPMGIPLAPSTNATRRTTRSSQQVTIVGTGPAMPVLGLNEKGKGHAKAAMARPTRQRALNNSSNVMEVAMAAAEAARASPLMMTPMLQRVFPSAAEASSSRTKMTRSLQIFSDDEEEM